ncbi:hypothetical protein LIER_12257 [Lithospermum erythrorhizon]|uniref:REF/SRPP-like protein n=1 Tax=Lithospermum erythrorhizon TaxID=34254 RepID=A0AAV3PVD6_LITER
MEKSGESELKYLGLVRVMAINAVVLVSNLYEFAKQSSGPLKSTVENVEKAVSTVVTPVYERFKGLPEDVLVFVDTKVDEAAHKFDEFAPPLAKKVVHELHTTVEKVSKLATNFVKEVQVSGPKAAISHAGELSKHFAVRKLAVAWYKIDHHPSFHGFAEMAVPTAAHWSEKYNKLIVDLTTNGYAIFSYLPLVPVEDMAKAYKQVGASVAKKDEATSSSGSDSD